MGGSSETVLKELAVTPSRLPSGVRLVMTVTPVPKRPKARRKSRGSMVMLFAAGFTPGSRQSMLSGLNQV
jgi:hypothetical protein